MAVKIIVSLLVSLDGFIADEKRSSQSLEEAFFIRQPAGIELRRPEGCDLILVGHKTFEAYRAELTTGSFSDLNVVVLASQPLKLTETETNVSCIKGKIGAVIAYLDQLADKVWVLGGHELINELTSQNLVDEIHLTTLPLEFGTGISLFNTALPAPKVELVDLKDYGTMTHSVWRKKK